MNGEGNDVSYINIKNIIGIFLIRIYIGRISWVTYLLKKGCILLKKRIPVFSYNQTDRSYYQKEKE